MTASIFTDKYDHFRKLLTDCRKAAGITQQALADLLEKPQSFVSKYEGGERRLDIIEFLQIAAALKIDVHHFIDQLQDNPTKPTILNEWEVSAEQLTTLLAENPSLKGMLLGYVAELKLKEIITAFPEVSYTTKFDDHNRKKKGDLYLVYQGRAFDVESKSLQSNMIHYNDTNKEWVGKAQVDASDRRQITLANGKKISTTLLLRGEFDVLAVNCYAFENKWRFVFARNTDLPFSSYKKYPQSVRQSLIASLVPVTWPPKPPFYANLRLLLDEMIAEGLGADPENLA